MVIPNEPLVPGSTVAASPSASDYEMVMDSEDERETELKIKGSATAAPTSSSHRQGTENARPKPPPGRQELQVVMPPRMNKLRDDKWKAQDTNIEVTPEGLGGYRIRDAAKTEARREESEQRYTGDKRQHPTASEGSHRDERRSKWAEDMARGTVADSRDQDASHRERQRTAGESQPHGSSATRDYATAARPSTKPSPQSEDRSVSNEGMKGDPPRRKLPQPGQHASHSPSEGRHHEQFSMEPRGPAEGAIQGPSDPPPVHNQDKTPKIEHDLPQEHAQSSSGGGIFGKIGTMFSGSGPSPQECTEHKKTIASLEEQLRRRGEELHKWQEQSAYLTKKLRQAEHEIQNSKENLRVTQNELSAVHKELVDAKALSDTRGKELLGSQMFLTKADTISMSEIGAMVQTLNSEIFQMAASISDSFRYEDHKKDESVMEDCFSRMGAIMGNPITWYLNNIPNPSEVNPLLVQIALQALLTAFCVWKIAEWHPQEDTDIESFLKALYQSIQQNENQAVSGRWRALTRARLRPEIEPWYAQFADELQVMMLLANWAPGDPSLKDSLGEKLRPVFSAALKLKTALGEQITSADIEVSVAQPEEPFNAREAEDEWGDARKPAGSESHDLIGGTTGLGLRRRVVPPQHDGSADTISYETIQPPKVVLVSSLQEIASPPPPRPKRPKKDNH